MIFIGSNPISRIKLKYLICIVSFMLVSYKPMTEEHLGTVISFMKKYGKQGTGFWYNETRGSPERMRGFLEKNNELSFVAIDDARTTPSHNEVIGMILGSCDGGRTGYLQRLFVHSSYRNYGVGTGITKHAVERLISLGCKHISADLPINNEPAKKILEKLGGEKVEGFAIFDIKK